MSHDEAAQQVLTPADMYATWLLILDVVNTSLLTLHYECMRLRGERELRIGLARWLQHMPMLRGIAAACHNSTTIPQKS